MNRWLAALAAFDRRLFHRLTRDERRVVDASLTRLSNAANRSWLVAAGDGPRFEALSRLASHRHS